MNKKKKHTYEAEVEADVAIVSGGRFLEEEEKQEACECDELKK